MDKLIYKNPILQFDFSDPDAIRVGEDFFMVASSFNNTPGVPVLHSKNLVEWELINYVFDKLPWSRFDKVQKGDGAWAPAIRYHNGTYYAIIPFPDEGIYISETKDPFGKWSDLWCVIEGKGIIDPCPVWVDDKCYIATGFAKSRIGFNSSIGLYEVTPDLKHMVKDYEIIYDGHDNNPTIEGPKFNVRNGYFYILAPAGSVKGGWQVALRSKNIHGPYESKVILMQNGTKVNGPHQGALIDLDDNDNWAFIHFQDMWAYGRIVHLQPVLWHNDWPICGRVGDPLLAGAPVQEGEYPIQVKTDYSVQVSDNFKGNKLSLMWQTPANKIEGSYRVEDGLYLNCIESEDVTLDLLPQTFVTKVPALEFEMEAKYDLNLISDNDEVGFTVMGSKYSYVSIKKIDGKNVIALKKGSFNNPEEEVFTKPYNEDTFTIKLIVKNEAIYDMIYTYEVNGEKLPYAFSASAGRWIGTTIGMFARGAGKGGFAKVEYFKTKIIK